MRRIAQLLLLLAFAFSQGAAVECPMGSAAPRHAHAAHAPAAHHAMGEAAHHPAPGHPRAPGHHGECIVMSCGAAAIVAAETAAAPVLASAGAPARAPSPYASPFIPIVSPPPRLAVSA